MSNRVWYVGEIDGMTLRWEGNIKVPRDARCYEHGRGSNFYFSGPYDGIDYCDDNWEKVYPCLFTCELCETEEEEALEALNAAEKNENLTEEEIDELSDYFETFIVTTHHTDEDDAYFLRYDPLLDIYYLTPTEQQLRERARELAQLSGQLMLPID